VERALVARGGQEDVERVRVQELAAQAGRRDRGSIHAVAGDRVAHRGKVRTDLMGTSRFEPDSNRLKGPWHATTVTVRVDIIARMTVDRMTVEQKTKKPGARYRAPGPTRC